MRRYLAISAAALAAAIASLGVAATTALAAGHASATALAAGPASAAAPKAPPATSGQAARASVRLYVLDAFFVHRDAMTVPGRAIRIGGVVAPYIAGQWVKVDAYVGRRLIKADRLRVKPSRDGRFGQFTEKLSSPRAGLLDVKVSHDRTAQMLGFFAQRRVAELSEHAGFGSRGPFVALIQQRLVTLHLYLPLSGVYDQQTGLAVDAYHRLLGHGVSPNLDPAAITDLLNGAGAFKVRYPRDGTHAEGNLSTQLLALIHGSKVDRIYPISSGKPSTPTVLGHFHVYLRDPGYLPDGMYYSDFFYGGYAIHGYDPAPDYPASHGCMRLPINDAISVFDWLSYGDVVDVYN